MMRSRDVHFRQKIVTQMPDVLRSDVIAPVFHSCARRDSADPGPAGGKRWTTEMSDFQFTLSYNSGNEFATSVITYEVFSSSCVLVRWKARVDCLGLVSGS